MCKMCNLPNRQEEDNVEEERAQQQDAAQEIYVAQVVEFLIALGRFRGTTIVTFNVRHDMGKRFCSRLCKYLTVTIFYK